MSAGWNARDLTNGEIICTVCKISKPLVEYYQYKDSRDKTRRYYRSQCKECCKTAWSRYNASYRVTEKAKEKETARHLKRRYGLTEDEFQWIYQELFVAQKGLCAICKTDVPSKFRNKKNQTVIERFNLDHCHATMKIRGLLCGQCNAGLGMFKDNKEWLRNAIQYLEANEK